MKDLVKLYNDGTYWNEVKLIGCPKDIQCSIAQGIDDCIDNNLETYDYDVALAYAHIRKSGITMSEFNGLGTGIDMVGMSQNDIIGGRDMNTDNGDIRGLGNRDYGVWEQIGSSSYKKRTHLPQDE